MQKINKSFFTVGIFLFLLSPFCFLQAQEINTKPPKNWHHLDEKTDGLRGISTYKAYELLKDRKSVEVLVAVIDSGIDWEHEDLKEVMWINANEIEGTKRDDDGNGYVDDIRGWNFLGNPDGTNVHKETMEVTREFRRLNALYGNKEFMELNANERDEYFYFERVRDMFYKEQQEYREQFDQVKQIMSSYEAAENIIKAAFDFKEINLDALPLLDIPEDNPGLLQARNYLILLNNNGLTKDQLKDIYEQLESYVEFGYNTAFDPRGIVESNYYNFENTTYGNSDVRGPDARHGTHVAGIIGAMRDNSLGMDGVADNVKIMAIRAVPDGDEYDKDVANAIRYAVDNGAKIINMSFGKSLSPQKFLVDDAVKYAQKKGVLLVHAAGNSAVNIDTTENYPTAQLKHTKKTVKNWLEVGASSHGDADKFVAGFSNFGQNRVHVFAPGDDIYATTPDNSYEYLSGTSMAAPVVSGLAAILMSYYPKMKVKHVIQTIMDSAVRYPDMTVKAPGSDPDDPYVSFDQLSISGGIVNAHEAILYADKKHGKRRAK